MQATLPTSTMSIQQVATTTTTPATRMAFASDSVGDKQYCRISRSDKVTSFEAKSVSTTEGEQIPPTKVNRCPDMTDRTLLAWFCDGINKISWSLLSATTYTKQETVCCTGHIEVKNDERRKKRGKISTQKS